MGAAPAAAHLDQNRHLVPDDEVWAYLVAQGTEILETMIEEGREG